jgi:hypothetical protein
MTQHPGEPSGQAAEGLKNERALPSDDDNQRRVPVGWALPDRLMRAFFSLMASPIWLLLAWLPQVCLARAVDDAKKDTWTWRALRLAIPVLAFIGILIAMVRVIPAGIRSQFCIG